MTVNNQVGIVVDGPIRDQRRISEDILECLLSASLRSSRARKYLIRQTEECEWSR
jgi:hypothetical protein